MAAVGVTSPVRFGYRDFSNELSHTLLHFPAISDNSSNSGLLDGATGSIALVGTALASLTKCAQAKDTLSIELANGSGVPTEPDAQREWAIRWQYQDVTTGKLYRFDSPAPIDAVIVAGTDSIDMSDALVIAFKTLFEADCVSPVGNDVVLIGGRIVGRFN